MARLECTTCKKFVDIESDIEREQFLQEHDSCLKAMAKDFAAHVNEVKDELKLTVGREQKLGHVMFNGIETDIRNLPISQESKAALFVTNEHGLLPPPNDAPKELFDAYMVELNHQVLGDNPVKREPDDDQPYISTEKIDNAQGREDLGKYALNLAMLAELQQQPGFVTPNVEGLQNATSSTDSPWLSYQRMRRRFLKFLYMDVISMVDPAISVGSFLHFVALTLKAFDDAHDAENLNHDAD